MRPQTLRERVGGWWNRPAGMGSLNQPYNPQSGGYGPTQGDVVKGVGNEALTLLSPMALESKAAGVIASRLPQRVKAAASGATEGYSVGSGLEKMGIPYGGRAGAVVGGLYGAVTGNDPLMSAIGKAGEAWRGRKAPTTPSLAQQVMSGGTSSSGPMGMPSAELRPPTGAMPITSSGPRGVIPGITPPTSEEALSGVLEDLRKELPTPTGQPSLVTGETAQQALDRQAMTQARSLADKVRQARTPTAVTGPSSASPAAGVGRAGSAGDLTSWREEDLWSGYMRNKGTPQGEALAREIQRRGLAASPAGTYRPPMPTEPPLGKGPSLKMRVAGEGTSMARGDMPPSDPAISGPSVINQMLDAAQQGTPEEMQMARQRLQEMMDTMDMSPLVKAAIRGAMK